MVTIKSQYLALTDAVKPRGVVTSKSNPTSAIMIYYSGLSPFAIGIRRPHNLLQVWVPENLAYVFQKL